MSRTVGAQGYTIGVYLPPATKEADTITFLGALESLLASHFGDRGGDRPEIVGQLGDVLHACIKGHVYLSTGCSCQGDAVLPDGRTGHEYCQSETGALGQKRPGVCKFCKTPCVCVCHQGDGSTEES